MNRLLLIALLASSSLFVGCPAPEPELPVRSCDQVIRFAPNATFAGGVQIAGEWNGFVPEPMQAEADGAFVKRLQLRDPRDYGYRFVIDGKLQRDTANPYSRWIANDEYSRLRIEDCRVPRLQLDAFSAQPDGRVEVRATYLDGSERKGPELASTVLLFDGQPRESTFDPATRTFTFTADGVAQGKHNIRIRAKNVEGREAEELYLPFWIEDEPFDWQEAVMYFAFTDRFRNGDPANDAPVPGADPRANYRGGDFAGITQSIEEGYFDKLGVRAIWISPVNANPGGAWPGKNGRTYTGYHGYWPSEPRTTQPRFGTLDELQALTRAAHARGIRVLTDLVINHTHEEHPYFAGYKSDGWFNTIGSCVCGDFGCDWDARRLDCWFTRYLPDLNWRSTQVVDQMTEDALFWVKEADLDGFRLDAVKHLDHVGGRTLGGRLNEISARTGIDYFLVGETFTGTEGRPLISEYIAPNELDGQFDFPLYWPVLDAFAKGGSLVQVDQAVKQNEEFYAPEVMNSPFIGNHDVPRFISHAAGQVEADSESQAWGNAPPERVDSDEAFRRSRDALTFVLTLPGVPLIYYGDEIGLPGAGDPDNRRLMRWDGELAPREAALLSHVQKVGQARRANRGLRYGARYTLQIDRDLLVYQRDDATGTDGAITAIHRGDEPVTVLLQLRGRLSEAEGQRMRDVISGAAAVISNGTLSLTLEPHSASVFIPAQ
ncbi:MAG: alpha-amylase family glycosyl hydrolase [Myxococcaceae bacterium]